MLSAVSHISHIFSILFTTHIFILSLWTAVLVIIHWKTPALRKGTHILLDFLLFPNLIRALYTLYSVTVKCTYLLEYLNAWQFSIFFWTLAVISIHHYCIWIKSNDRLSQLRYVARFLIFAVTIPTVFCLMLFGTSQENKLELSGANSNNVSKDPFVEKLLKTNVSFDHIYVLNKSALGSIKLNKFLICDKKLQHQVSHVLIYVTFGMIIPLSTFFICYKLVHKFTKERYNAMLRALGTMDQESQQLLQEREKIAYHTLLVTLFVILLTLILPMVTEAGKWGNFDMPIEVYELKHFIGSAGILVVNIVLCLLQTQFRSVSHLQMLPWKSLWNADQYTYHCW